MLMIGQCPGSVELSGVSPADILDKAAVCLVVVAAVAVWLLSGRREELGREVCNCCDGSERKMECPEFACRVAIAEEWSFIRQ